ncbi:hypothetical protein [Mycobacterium genavense]|nr:hypothetical protein [Mycobacterium genavense]
MEAFSTPLADTTNALSDAVSGLSLDSGTVSTLSDISAIWIMALPTPL